MRCGALVLALVLLAASARWAPAADLRATEVLGLRVGHGSGAFPRRVDPWLMDLFAVDSQGRFLFLDPQDGPGAVGIYDPHGKFLRRIPVLRPEDRRWPVRAYHLWVDGADNLYLWLGVFAKPASYTRVRMFDTAGRFIRDIDIQGATARYVDRHGHIFGDTLAGVVKEFDANGQLVRQVPGMSHSLDLLVDPEGQILFRQGPAPEGIAIAPELAPDRGDLFRDRAGNYYWNASVDGICADFFKYGPDRILLDQFSHVALMRRIGYRHRAVEYLRNGGTKSTTSSGRFCTLGWYLSPGDQIYALAGSDSLPKGQPWLRVLHVEVQ